MKINQLIDNIKAISNDFKIKENMFSIGIKGKVTQIFYCDILIANISEKELNHVYYNDLFKYHIPDLNLAISLINSYSKTPLNLR